MDQFKEYYDEFLKRNSQDDLPGFESLTEGQIETLMNSDTYRGWLIKKSEEQLGGAIRRIYTPEE